MKDFIIKGVIFMVLLWGADRLVGSGLKWMYDNQKDEEFFYASEAMERQVCDLVVLGSSRARNHYNPDILQEALGMSCFNAGRSGHFLMYQSAQLHVMLSRYTPKRVILDLTPYDFTGGKNYDRLSALLPYKNHPETHRFLKMRSDFEMWKCTSEIYPYNSMFFKLLPNLKAGGIFRANGFQPLEGKLHGSRELYEESALIPDADKVDEFERVIRLCREMQIQLTVVTSPYYADFDKQTVTTQRVKEICEREGIQYLNFLNDEDFMEASLYHTVDHLNAKGADMFTRKLSSQIN